MFGLAALGDHLQYCTDDDDNSDFEPARRYRVPNRSAPSEAGPSRETVHATRTTTGGAAMTGGALMGVSTSAMTVGASTSTAEV